MNATASIPSSHKLSNEKWLLYFSLTSSGDGGGKEALHLQPPFLDRLLAISNRLYYAVGRKHVFHFRFSSLQLAFLGIAYALSTFRRKTIAEVIGFLRRSFKHGSKISLKCVAVHEGPRVSADGVLEVCNNCPDATIRDGKLIPICLADHLPLSDLIGFTSQHKRSN